jgi:predicted permease
MRGDHGSERAPQWRRALRLWRRDPLEELEEELRFHVESRRAEFEAAGCSPEEAERLARERLGDTAEIRAKCDALLRARERRSRRLAWLWGLRQDLQFGWRSLRRTPGFTLVAALSLALGVGANTAIFGLMYTVLFARLRVPDAEQLIQVRQREQSFLPGPALTQQQMEQMKKSAAGVFAYDEYVAFQAIPALELASWISTGASVVVGTDYEFPGVSLVDGRYFAMLRIRPLLGRLISADDEQRDVPVAVVSEQFWERRLARDPAVLGRGITIGNAVFTVIGVTPRSFRGLSFPGSFEVAIPLTATNAQRAGASRDLMRPPVQVVGRVRGDRARVQSELDALYQRCCARGELSGGFASGGPPPAVELRDISRGQTEGKLNVRAQYSRVLYVLMGGVVVLLLLSCANVSNLLLARARARERELALRHSLGARASRLVQQLLTESTQLALLGAAGGLLIARWGTNLLAAQLPANIANLSDLVRFRLDPVMLGFTTGVAFLCSLLFGVLPALRAARVDLVTPLKEGGRSVRRAGALDGAIVSVQIALALLLVSGGGLLVQTLRNLREVETGFDAAQRLLLVVETRGTPLQATGLVPVHQDILARVQAVPGVRAAALASYLPIYGGRLWLTTERVERPAGTASDNVEHTTQFIGVTPGYFAAAGIVLRAGREFGSSDSETAERVAVVSESFVERYLPGRDALGETIQPMANEPGFRIVGIAAEAVYQDLRSPPDPVVYLPVTQSGRWPFLEVIAHTAGEPALLAETVRDAVVDAAPGVWIRVVMTMEEAINQALARERLMAALALLFGVLALSLAAVGLFGVMAYHVSGRTGEIGTRMALGARAGNVLWLVLRQSLLMLAAGFVIGLPMALIVGRLIAAQLFGVSESDPATLVAATASLLVVGVLAVLVPARRAVGVDPVTALRAD